MISALKKLFSSPEQESVASQDHRLRLAAAALLIETARSDFSEDDTERNTLEALLISSLKLPAEEVHELIEAARERVAEATSLYEFTRTINDHYSAQHKCQLIEAMWKVAYADGDLDKHEEHLIRQVAELIYVPHQDYIRCKLAAQP